jgi:hypothetical protein
MSRSTGKQWQADPKIKSPARLPGYLFDSKSGTRDSNPRLRPWQIGCRLNLNNNRAYGVYSPILSGIHGLTLRQLLTG